MYQKSGDLAECQKLRNRCPGPPGPHGPSGGCAHEEVPESCSVSTSCFFASQSLRSRETDEFQDWSENVKNDGW